MFLLRITRPTTQCCAKVWKTSRPSSSFRFIRSFSSVPGENEGPTKEAFEKMLANQEKILAFRREDILRSYVNALEHSRELNTAMETSRAALVACGIDDRIACEELKAIELDNPITMKDFKPFVALGLIITMPAIIVRATWNPVFFQEFCDVILYVTGVNVQEHSWDTSTCG